MEVSLPSSLEMVATDISRCDNESAVRKLGVVGGTTKNASCSKLRDENASCSDLRDLQSRGTCRNNQYVLGVPGPMRSEL